MIIRRLEIQLDMRRTPDRLLKGLSNLFSGRSNRHFSDPSLELSMSAECGPACFASDDGIVCRIIGNDDAVISTFGACGSELESKKGFGFTHENAPLTIAPEPICFAVVRKLHNHQCFT
jgi:hypothetical protein